jgi:PAS domain S-box-containing protein
MPKILAIDDRKDNLVALTALLTNLMPGCEVVTALSGPEGLEKARTGQPDVILLDVQMPGVDGFETCRRLMADESTRSIPVVMVTAVRTDAKSRVGGLEIGANAYLAKPIDPVELVSQVKVALRIKAAEDSLRQQRDSLERLVEERTASLRDSQERLRVITEASPDADFVYDADGRFIEVNPVAEERYGYSRDEFLNMTVRDLCAPDLIDQAENRLRQALTDGLRIEWCHRCKDGREIPVDVAARPFMLLDRLCVFSSVRDISERKNAEAEREKLQAQFIQVQKMESVGRLAGGVAHDFNNMLGIILGYTELAMNKVDSSDPAYADLEEVLNATRRSADITRQLLAFARKQIVEPVMLDLNNTVESMLKMLRRLIGEDISLAWLPGADVWPVKIDPAQIDQILANLCVNARDAIAGVGRITIETANVTLDEAYCALHPGFVPGPFALLAASDDGCGMDPETLDHLFEPFFTTKEVGKGTGLGLATVYGILKQNGGFINVYSEPGHGTTFKIYLPRHAGEDPAVEARKQASISSSRGETVLLVEDELSLLEMIRQVLERLGYRVLAADTPGEAIRLAEAHPCSIDLLITDVVMPGMNGRDLAERLQALYPNLKVLFMSGYTADAIVHHDVLEQGVHFVQKPFNLTDLAHKVRQAIGKQEERRNREISNHKM